MADNRYTPDERELFEREFENTVRAELPSIRQEEIRAAARRAAERELEQRRDEYREELDERVAAETTESATERRQEANRETPSKLVLGIVLLILFLFLLAIFGEGRVWGRGSTAGAASSNDGATLPPILGGPQATPISVGSGASAIAAPQTGRGLANAGGVDGTGAIAGYEAQINELFRPYYQSRDGLRLFGYPIGPLETVNGRQVQWFERARLEYWPEYAGTAYEIQPGLIGSEYTDGREFPRQTFFPNREGLRFFPETEHGVGGAFLNFWNAYGGLDTFGYPISDEVIEISSETGRYHTVQYFQRVRMELHPEYQGTANEVQLGLLGRALYLNEQRATLVTPVAPTAVALP